MKARTFICFGLVSIFGIHHSKYAFAQSAAAAKALFDEAELLMNAAGDGMKRGLERPEPKSIDECRRLKGDTDPGCRSAEAKFREACAKLQDSTTLDPSTVNYSFRLAICYDVIDKLASARAEFAKAQPKLHGPEAAWANDRLRDLESRVPRLIIHPPDHAQHVPTMKIGLVSNAGGKKEDVQLVRSIWGKEYPIDGGEYTIRAEAEGYEPYEHSIKIDNDATGKPPWEVRIPPLRPRPALVASLTGAPRVPAPLGWQSALGWTSVAVGGIGLVAGAIAGGVATLQWGSADGQCPVHKNCSSSTQKLGEQAGAAADVSTVSFSVAGVGAAGALLFLVVLPRYSQKVARSRLIPTVALGTSGVVLTGKF